MSTKTPVYSVQFLYETENTISLSLTKSRNCKGKLPLLLQEHADSARMSRRLAIIRRDAPVAPDPACMEWPQTLSAQCHTRLLQLGLKGVAARFETEESELPPKRQAVTLTRQDELRVAVERLARAKRIALELGEPWTIAGEDEEASIAMPSIPPCGVRSTDRGR